MTSRTILQVRGAKLAVVVLGISGTAAGAAFALGVPSPIGHAAAAAPALKLTISPSTRTVTRGSTASYTVRIVRRDRATATMSLLSTLPRHATAIWSTRSTRGTQAVLKITTKDAPSGTRHLRVQVRVGRRRATALLTLVVRAPRASTVPAPVPVVPAPAPAPVVAAPAPPAPVVAPPVVDTPQPSNFTISGDLASTLEPGSTSPLDLALVNPGAVPITITALTVGLTGVTAPLSDVSHPCSNEDFVVTQFAGGYGFTLAPGSTQTLSDLGVPEGQWPQVTMTNRSVNQNGCKGASLQLAFGGSAATS